MELDITLLKTLPTRRDGTERVCLKLQDKDSRVVIGQVSLSLEQFGKMLAINGFVDATMDVVGDLGYSRLGYVRENKNERVPKDLVEAYSHPRDNASADKAIIDYLSDHGLLDGGWVLSSNGLGTQQPSEKHQIILERFIRPLAN